MEKFIHFAARKTIEFAVRHLPSFQRDEWLEEWLADLDERDGISAKLRHACGCVWCVFKTVTDMNGLPAPAMKIAFNGVETFGANEIAGLRMMAYWVFYFGMVEKDARFKRLTRLALSFVQRSHHLISHEESQLYGRYLYELSSAHGGLPIIHLDGVPVQPDKLADELEARFRKHSRALWRGAEAQLRTQLYS